MSCSFCSPMTRKPQAMTPEQFSHIIDEIKPYTDYVYLHVKGEPLMHNKLSELLSIAHSAGLQVNITTNGTLLKDNLLLLCENPVRQINISLHSIEDNIEALDEYITSIVTSVRTLAEQTSTYLVMRLWNLNKLSQMPKENLRMLDVIGEQYKVDLHEAIKSEQKLRSITLADHTYLSHDEEFEWPSIDNPFYSKFGFCYGLNRMAAILVDGTVVPCCLDADGIMALGNLFSQSFAEIIDSQRAKGFVDSFAGRRVQEELCRHCTYKKRFNRMK